MRLYGRIFSYLTITAAVLISIPDSCHASTYSHATDVVCFDGTCGHDDTTARMILYGNTIPVPSLFDESNSIEPYRYMLKESGLDGHDCEYRDAEGRASFMTSSSGRKDNGCRNREGNKGKGDRPEHDDHDNHNDDDGNGNNNTPVPEPSTIVLAGSGLACLAFLRRYKTRKR